MNITLINNGEAVLVDGIPAKLLKNDQSMSRRRFKYKNLIIKLDEDPNIEYDQQSTRELIRWEEISDKDKIFFQKPIYGRKSSGGNRGFIVQEIIKFRKGRTSDSLKEFMKKLARKYDIHDVEANGSINWGVDQQGVPKIFDWGI